MEAAGNTKRCRKCENVYPATLEHFYKQKNGKYDLSSWCKSCKNEWQKQYNEEHWDSLQIYRKDYRSKNKVHLRKIIREHYEKNRDYLLQHYRDKRARDRDRINKRERELRAPRREATNQRARERYAQNPLPQNESSRTHYAQNPEMYMFKTQQYKARKRALPATLTEEEWEQALEYWNNQCVYCKQAKKLGMDHFIPLTDESCPGTVAENILPSCRSCNCSKCDRDPIAWMRRKFGEESAQIIMKQIEAYFATIKH
jgi:hypothetical protein